MNHYYITICQPGERQFTFQYSVANATVATLLEKIFAWFNAGSGREHVLFMEYGMRSLSVNDFAAIDGQWYQCCSIGWRMVDSSFIREISEVVEHRMNVAMADNKQESPWFILNSMKHEQNWPLQGDFTTS